MDLARLGSRALFPQLDSFAYLAHAAISPPSTPVERRVQAALAASATRGALAFAEGIAQRDRVRANLARLIGATTSEIALMANTTRGVSDVAFAIDWRPGERVLVFRGEFPTNVTPWQRAAETFGLRLCSLEADALRTETEAALAQVEAELAAGVRLMAISAVAFQTGFRAPLAELGVLCERYGCELFVDGIQACGAVPLDVGQLKVDYLAAGSHKWLMGPEGAGFLYVAARRQAALRPRTIGWLSHEEGVRFLFEGAGHLRMDRPLRRDAQVFEGGMLGALAFAGLEASLELLMELGVEAIDQHIQGYLDALEPELEALGLRSLRAKDPHHRSGILAVTADEHDVLALQRGLTERGVACSVPDGCLRFAPHWPNHPDEVPRVAAALREVMAH